MQMPPFSINSKSEVWRFAAVSFESGLPQGRPSLFVCKCVFVRVCIPAFVCVSRVCSAPRPGTSAMPPLSQFLTSVLKKTCGFRQNLSSLLCSSHSSRGRTEGDARSSPTARMFDFSTLFFFLSPTLFYYSKSSLSPNWLPREMKREVVNRSRLKSSCFFRVSLPHGECRLPGETAAASTHGVSQQTAPQLASIHLRSSRGCCRLSPTIGGGADSLF